MVNHIFLTIIANSFYLWLKDMVHGVTAPFSTRPPLNHVQFQKHQGNNIMSIFLLHLFFFSKAISRSCQKKLIISQNKLFQTEMSYLAFSLPIWNIIESWDSNNFDIQIEQEYEPAYLFG